MGETNKEYIQESAVPRRWETHGGEDVPVYAQGVNGHLFRGVVEQTFIPYAISYASCIGPFKKLCQEHIKKSEHRGGVIGLSTAYHLNELGYNNVIVIERDEITSGTTWHTNGLVWRLRPSETDINLLSRTHELVSKRLLSHSGVDATGWINNGGLFLAHNTARMQEYQRLHGMSKYYGIESYILDKSQTIDLLKPLIDEKTSDLTGGLYSPNDGFVDPHMYCSALIKAANIQVFSKCRLIAINTSDCFSLNTRQRKVNKLSVQYNGLRHDIETSVVVNSSGVWAPIVAKLAGIDNIPQETMEHSYVITEPIEGVVHNKTPNIRDHDLSIAFRVSGKSLCIGGYEPDPVLISHKISTLEPFTLFDLNWDKFGIHLENSAKLMPIIGETGIKATTCGPESFTPDHKPLLGEDPLVRGFFHASAFNSFGISLSGGVGYQMAKWLTTGSPDIDLSAYDIKRFNRHLINNRVWSHERCREAYARNYARNETFSDALYELLKSNGCVYRERHGIQCPDWFDLVSTPLTTEQYIDLDNTYDWSEDSRQWKAIKYECQSCHERAALFNLSSMAKYLVRGENALQVIDSLSPTDVKSMLNNSTILSYLLNTRGGITAEIIINKVNDNQFYITCADISTNHAMKMRLIRFSQVSHTGWELHLNNGQHLKTIYNKIIANDLVANAGYRAYESLKNENQWLSGCLDMRSEDMLWDVGLDTHICEHKRKQYTDYKDMRSEDQNKHYVWIRPENKRPIVCGLEPIWSDSQAIGFVRKNFYSHKSQRMLAFGLIYDKFLKNSNIPSSVEIEIFGNLYQAKVDKVVCKQT
ncbi:unnamed protein product [Oppiella nova]|uniref:alkaline phosphatase n=1 Tax=Oppiella nova TaxID=334625 RepID=A0A7R9QIV0_9ACAR|nr:unnamed protein product [Oppiella nova]CAG2165859.1 unnamed protein product [Oppiella nova]